MTEEQKKIGAEFVWDLLKIARKVQDQLPRQLEWSILCRIITGLLVELHQTVLNSALDDDSYQETLLLIAEYADKIIEKTKDVIEFEDANVEAELISIYIHASLS